MNVLIERNREAIGRLCDEYGIRRLDLFGSASSGGDFDPQRSDVDFLVDFGVREEPIDVSTYLRFRDELASLLGRPVDLVVAGSVRNPYVLAEIERSRERVHAA